MFKCLLLLSSGHLSNTLAKFLFQTKKDELLNSILDWFMKGGVYWHPNEVENGITKIPLKLFRTFYGILMVTIQH